ncbi:MAG: amino acid permease [Acidobacteria bacterium]|nr:amino acid permease [Acidobacteriota bacterium]
MHSSRDLPRRLGLTDSAAIVAGTTIGAGIFLVPNLVARSLPSAGWMIAVWIFTGVLSCLGALAYAELGAMLPATGGPYVFLREAFGTLPAFLSGWTYFFVVMSASAAWLAINFATYLGQFVALGSFGREAVAVALIALVTAVNYRGVKLGAAVQKLFTLAKLAGLAVLVGAAFFAFAGDPAPVAAPAPPVTFAGFGVAMIACLTAYDGWISLSAVAGEVKRPERNLPLGVLLGVGTVIAIYVIVNLAYLRVLGPAGIAGAERVGASAAARVLGPLGAGFISLVALISIVGSANGWMLAGPRLFFAQARDGLFFRALAEVHPRFQTPHVAILVLGAWSALLAVTGTYETLAAYAMYATWVFYLLTVLGLAALRRRQPERPRPYRLTGYPLSLAAFALVALGFVVNTFVATPGPAIAGTLFMLAGVPVYCFWKLRE